MGSKFRYPGPSPFTPLLHDVFFGRDQDTDLLYNSVQLNNCTTLVGKSGVGKSSLLNAKLIPLLHNFNENNSKRKFEVIKISVGPWTPTEPNSKTLLQKVFLRVKHELGNIEEINFLPFVDSSLSLGFNLKKYQFKAYSEGINLIFLFVVDQVEELFTYPYNEFKELLLSIKELLNPNIPDKIRTIIEKVERSEPSRITRLERESLYTQMNIKFLFSIRIDKLGLLIRLKEAIPSIFSNPYELRPLSKDQAIKAIKLPAEQDGSFETPKFQISDTAANKIVDYLWGIENHDLESNFEELKIEPITLQIICQHIEQKILPSDSDKVIEAHEIDDFDDMLSNYYLELLSSLNLEDQLVARLRRLIEEEMIYEQDKRRKQIFMTELEIELVPALRKLVDLRLIKEINNGNSNRYYELGHDWLVIPVLNAKKKRIEEEQKLREERMDISLSSSDIADIDIMDSNSLKIRADNLFEQRDFQLAIIYYTKAIRKLLNEKMSSYGLNEVYLKRAESYFRVKDYHKSKLDYQYVLNIDEHNISAQFYLAFNYQLLNNLDAAIQLYENVIILDSTHINAHYNLGVAYMDSSLLENSLTMFLKVTELDPYDANTWYNAGVICNKTDKFSRAIDYLRKSIELKPDNHLAFAELGLAYFNIKEYMLSLDSYEEVMKLDPNNASAAMMKIKIYEVNNFRDALNTSKLVENSSDSENEELILKLAKIYYENGNFEESLNYLDKLKNTQIKNPEVCKIKATIYKELGKYNEELKSIEELLEVFPYDSTYFERICELYYMRKDILSLQSAIEKMNLAGEKPYKEKFNLAILFFESKEYDSSIKLLSDLMSKDFCLTKVYFYLGECYFNLNCLEEADKFYSMSHNLDPFEGSSAYKIGLISYRSGDKKRAYSFFSLAEKSNQDNTEVSFYKSKIKEELADVSNTDAQWQKAVEINERLNELARQIREQHLRNKT